MSRLLRHLSYANVVSTLALCLVVGGGTALAANTVFSSDIVDGEVKSVDIGTGEVRSVDIGGGQVTNGDLGASSVSSTKILNGGVTGADLAGSSVTGAHVLDGSLSAADLDESTLRYPAFAQIEPNGTVSTEAANNKGIDGADVQRVAPGVYCFNFDFTPRSFQVSPWSASHAPRFAQVLGGPIGWPSGCSPSDNARVDIHDQNGNPVDDRFFIWVMG